jgi:hypothetical protein
MRHYNVDRLAWKLPLSAGGLALAKRTGLTTSRDCGALGW